MLIQHFKLAARLDGEELALLNMSKALQRLGIDPIIIAQEGVEEHEVFEGVEVFGTGPGPYGLTSLTRRIELDRSLEFSVIHSHEERRTFLHGFLKLGTPLVVHYHNPLSVQPRSVGRFMASMKVADRIFVPSAWVAKVLSSSLRVPPRKISVIHNGVDTQLFQRRKDTEDLRKYGIPEEGSVIQFVGRCSPVKGIMSLVRAIPVVLREFPGTRFIFVGVQPREDFHQDSYYARILQEVNTLGITRSCTFLPFLNQRDLPQFYSRATITVVPSIMEAFGQTVVESLSCGTPVIATRVGGLPEIVTEAVGSLVPVNDSTALANSILKLLRNEELRIRMGVSGRMLVEKSFTWESTAKKIKQEYLELVAA